MSYIKRFKEISSEDVSRCGGKGASLGELMRAGFPFADGFVLTIDAFGTDSSQRMDEVYKAYDDLDAHYVAVRSSATKEDGIDDSFAGQFDTYLFVDKDTLIEKISECHASLDSDRIQAYCESKNINRSEIKVAVVIQKMINSEVAGVVFTANPISSDLNEIIIEGGFGLGEAVVSGMITPDNYIWNKQTQTITQKNIGHQHKKLILDIDNGGIKEESIESTVQSIQKLSDDHITQLSIVCENIEKHYAKPMDIERALEDDTLYILQARPITTLHTQVDTVPREKVLQRNFPILAYTTGAYYEFHGMTLGPVTRKRDREIMAAYKVPQVFLIQDPRAYYTSNINDIITQVDTDFEKAVDEYNQNIYDAVRIAPGKTFDDLKKLSEIHKLVYGLMLVGFDLAIDIKTLIDQHITDQPQGFEAFVVTPSQKTAIQREQDAVTALKGKAISDDAITQLAYDFGYIHQDYLGSARGVQEYRTLLDKEEVLTSHMDETQDISHLTDYQQRLIAIFKKIIYMYEEGRNAMVRCMWAMKQTSIALDIDTDKLLYMTVQELENLCEKQDLGYIISDHLFVQRKEAFLVHFDQGVYEEYTGNIEVENAIKEIGIMHFWDKKTTSLQELKGTTAFPGYAKGRARIVFDQHDADAVQEGEILISPMTQVEFLGGMRKCAAIVTDEGGIICHAAIVSREFGKPCVLATGLATTAIKNGDLVEVDATNGIVKILERANILHCNGIDRKIVITRNMSFWHQYLAALGAYHNSVDFGVNFQLEELSYTKQGTKSTLFVDRHKIQGYSDAVMVAVSSYEAIEQLKQRYIAFGDDLKAAVDTLSDNISSDNRNVFTKEYQRYSAGLFLTSTIGRAGVEKITAALTHKGYAPAQIPNIINTITYPEEHTPLYNAQQALLRIAAKIQKGESIDKKTLLEEWLATYGHIPVNYCDDPWTTADANQQLNDLLAENCDEVIKNNKNTHKEKIQRKQALLQDIADEEISLLAQALSVGTFLNEYRKNIFSYVSLKYRSTFSHVAQLLGSENWKDVFYLLPDEIHDVLSGSLLDLPKIKEDRHSVAYQIVSGNVVFLKKTETETVDEYLSDLYETENIAQDVQELTGFAASSGVVSGKVKVVLSKDDFYKVNTGDILVTTMTSVDFVPVMKKAAAFVTNEGGITSHASIVAREMNKPCIIGTQNATQVLCDGDLVEVDANNGVVKILEKIARYEQGEYGLLIQDKNVTPFVISHLCDVMGNELGEFLPQSPNCAFHFRGGDMLRYADLNQMNAAAEYIVEKLFSLPGYYTEFNTYLRQNIESCAKFSQHLYTKDLGKLSNKELFNIYMDGIKIYKESYKYGIIPTFTDIYKPVLTDRLKKELKLFAGNDDDFLTLTTPTEVGGVLSEEKELLEIVLNENMDDYEKKVENHINKYFRLPFGYEGPAYTKAQAEKTIEELKNNPSISIRYQEVKDRTINHQEKISQCVKKLYLPQDLQNVFALVRERIFLKGMRKESYFMFYAAFDRLADEIANRLDINKSLIKFLLTDELEDTLLTKKTPSDIYERSKNSLYKFDGKRIVVSIGPEVDKFITNNLVSISDSQDNIINGQTAFPGKITGVVKIVNEVADIKKISPGDILVSFATNPNLLPAMIKSAAFITDVGGITCHAAIASRELKKPCIIGTRVATQVLRDGDLIEVDATNGVVKIIEKLRDQILSKKWKKNRAGQRSLLSAAYFNHNYTVQLKEVLGVGLEQTMTVTKNGNTYCYFDTDHQRAFGEYFANLAKQDEAIIQQRCQDLIMQADAILACIEDLLDKPANRQNFDTFINAFDAYGVPHRIIKIVVDYLSPQLLQKYLPDLERARIHAEPVYTRTEDYIKYVAESLAQKYNISSHLILTMTRDQFDVFLDTGSFPDISLLERQEKMAVLYMDKNNAYYYFDQDAYDIEQAILEDKHTTSITGHIAYTGSATGTVRIVTDPKNPGEFNQGDILVTGMTRPEYLPLVEKCAAFVTDAGGVLSHAAITARELKKPCIIGTEVATKLLRDGDIVEVDANTGTIRIV